MSTTPRAALVLAAAITTQACVPAPGPLPLVPFRPVWQDPMAQDHSEGFPTRSEDRPTPLSQAVIDDDVDRVRSLLDRGADPDARWTQRGDRFPLMEAIHASAYGHRLQHRDELVRLLLARGADPNARYCPFESRGGGPPGMRYCTNEQAMTPLMGAASYGYSDVVYRLLDAGAQPLQQNWNRDTALDLARDEFTYRLILVAAYPGPDADRRAAEDLLNREYIAASEAIRAAADRNLDPAHAAYGRLRLLITAADIGGATAAERTRWLSRGLPGSWYRLDRLNLLLEHGADANLRRCDAVALMERDSRCTPETGTTVLMEAAFWGGYWGHTEPEGLLTQHGADPARHDWRGRRADDYRALGEARRREDRRRGIVQLLGFDTP